MPRIGDRQAELLMALGCPSMRLVVPSKISDTLERRMLVRPTGPKGGLLQITPAGLRTLADLMDEGRIDAILAKRAAKRSK